MIAPGAGTPISRRVRPTNRATIKLRVDTSANSLTGSFQLVAVAFTYRGNYDALDRFVPSLLRSNLGDRNTCTLKQAIRSHGLQ